MNSILASFIFAICAAKGYTHQDNNVNDCEIWYVNCVMSHSKGDWNNKDIDRCQNEEPANF